MSTLDAVSTDYDAIVIGAGFAGLCALRDLRERHGMSVKVIEVGTDVGGTWYWTRYPGARTDTESWAYCLTHDPELLDEWEWSERYPAQPEVLRYLQHVSERYDLRRDIQFETAMTTATYDEEAEVWTVGTDRGEQFTCRYFVTGLGVLAQPLQPPFPGLESFEGEWYQTARWPHEGVDLRGKRVGIIGTGATAVQAIPLIARDAKHLTVFQRTPNFVIPSRNYPLSDEQRAEIKREYDEILEVARGHFFGIPLQNSGLTIADVTPEEYERRLERAWETGGFSFIFETFDDFLTDEASNARAAEFVRDKIRTIVEDPATAELLCPTSHPIGAKRPPLGHLYYETFNREDVTLVDVSQDAIDGMTPTGIRTVGGAEYDVDVLIFATGFDASTGSFKHLDIRGRGGRTIAEHWQEGPRTFLGMTVDGFPNMFMICGPQAPFANIPVVVEANVEWIGRAITETRERGRTTIEPTPEAVQHWREHMDVILGMTLLGKGLEARSWFLGANVPGKPPVVLFYFGGAGNYAAECRAEADGGFTGFRFADRREAVGA